MKLLFETDSKKRAVAQRGYNGVMGFRMTRGKYSDVLLMSIFKKIFKRLNLIDYTVNSPDAITTGSVSYFLNNEMSAAFAELFQNGFVLFHKNSVGVFKYIRKNKATQTPEGWYYENQPLDVFYSDTYEVFGMSDGIMLKDTLKAIDSALNANQTIIKRLGVVVTGTPEQPSQNPQMVQMDGDEKDEMEKEIQNDYGMLEEQKQFLLFRRPMKLQRIALGGKDLMITETVETFTKILCDATNIPYDVMAMSGQSTFNNMEQAEKSMQDTAEEFVSKIWTFLKVMNIDFSWKVNNSKYGKAITV
ncbi:MAG TPA: phage portal protein [Paludibacteraceae bacterium]|nr:phage portal protein [Paludibacteraceae bacterium]